MDNRDNNDFNFEKIMEQVKEYVDERLSKTSKSAKRVLLSTRITKEQAKELENLKFIYEVRSGKRVTISDIIRQELEQISLEELRDILPPSKANRNVIFNIRCTQVMKDNVIQWGRQLEVSKERIAYAIILLILEKERRGESAFADYIKSLQ